MLFLSSITLFFATLTAPLGLTYSDPLTDLGVNFQLPSALLAGTATGTLKQTSVLKLRVTQSFCSQMCVAKSGDSKCRDTGTAPFVCAGCFCYLDQTRVG